MPSSVAPHISARAQAIDVSGIRRVFELGAKLADPINLSIGQPDFAVPEPIKRATIDAIEADENGYTLTQGTQVLRDRIARHLRDDLGWTVDGAGTSVLVTSGTSGALMLACLAMLDPGDEIVVPDPYFVIYPALAEMAGARAVLCDTYPDFRMTAERVEPLLTDRTRLVLVNSPGNPSGVVLTQAELDDLAELCQRRGIVLVTDEIYDAFTFADAREQGHCPSPARSRSDLLLVRGFGKTYGCTGWRLGYAAGPEAVIAPMRKLQQYSFVCAPSMAQAGAAAALDVDMSEYVADYERRRDLVLEALAPVTTVARPGGAFYAFFEVPPALGMTATQFVEHMIERNVLTIPGSVFSAQDTHVRLSFAAPEAKLVAGLELLRAALSGA